MRKLCCSAMFALITVGCASTGGSGQAGGDESFEAAGGSRQGNVANREYLIDLIAIEDAPADNLDYISPNNIINFYTRIDISTATPEMFQSTGLSQELTYEQRAWWKRLFVGKESQRAFELKVDIKSQGDDIPFRNTIFNVDYTSNRRQGEIWSRKSLFSAIEDKYIRIYPETVISITPKVSYTDRISSEAVQLTLDAVSRAAKLIDSSALVTSVTEPKLKEFSNFADETISQLFAKSIYEEVPTAFPITTLRSDTSVLVAAYLPDLKSNRRKLVGTWKIRIHPPKISMFSDLHICLPDQMSAGVRTMPSFEEGAKFEDLSIPPKSCAYVGYAGQREEAIKRAYSVVSGPQVLAFNISESQTLRQYIESNYQSQIEVLNRKEDDSTSAEDRVFDGTKFCNDVVYDLETLGFNTYDATVGLWAFVTSGPLRPKAQDLLFGKDVASIGDGACAQHTYPLNTLGLIHGDKNRMLKINYAAPDASDQNPKADNF